MERMALRSTSSHALLAELHRQDLLREAAGPRVPAPSFADELRTLRDDAARWILMARRTRGSRRPQAFAGTAVGVERTAANASATTRIASSISASVAVPYPNSSPGRAVACTE